MPDHRMEDIRMVTNGTGELLKCSIFFLPKFARSPKHQEIVYAQLK